MGGRLPRGAEALALLAVCRGSGGIFGGGDVGEVGEEGLVGFFDAGVVGRCAVGFDGEGGDMEVFFGEAGEGGEVGADDGGDGGADEGEEGEGAAGGLEGLGGGGEFF